MTRFRLCVTPANFAAQLDEIARHGEPSTLAELSLPSRRPRVVVTFDDGYVDNLTNALPIAEAKGIPITVFVTSGVLGGQQGFWWDRLGTLLRSRPSGTREICLPTSEGTVRIGLGSSRPMRTSSRFVTTCCRFRWRRSTASSMPSRSNGGPRLRRLPMLDR